MALVWADRVLETSSTTGTGSLTLAGARTGFRAFSSVCSTSDIFYYYIEAVDGSGVPTGAWETGLGTYSGANTLARTIVHASSNSGSLVSFAAGTKNVGISATAGKIKTRGCMVSLASDSTGLNLTSAPAVAFGSGSEQYDTDSVHDTVTNNDRLTVPTGVSKVRLSANLFVSAYTGTEVAGFIRKNGSSSWAGYCYSVAGYSGVNVSSPIVLVTGGDYFTLHCSITGDTSVTLLADRTWFCMEIIE